MGILRTDKISGLEKPTAVTGSVSFDGNDHLSIGSAGDFNFLHNGATDWTVEFWAKTGTVTRQFVWGTGGSSAQTGFHIHIMSQADGQADAPGIYASVGRGAAGNYITWGANDCLTLNTWHHIAAVFKSSDKTLALYVDGREIDNDSGTVNGTFAAGNYSSSNSSFAFIVGKNLHGGGNYMNGEISNLRVVAGRRLYTSNFTPPVHALEPINGTRILCCNNPDSVTAVSNADIGTAHIATASGDPTVATDNPSLTRDFTGGTEFKGVTTFDTQGYFVPPSGTTAQRGSGRGIVGGQGNAIHYIHIHTQGNSQDFGDLAYTPNGYTTSYGSNTRGLIAGGYSPTVNTINYITIATTGDAKDFGDISLSNGVYGMGPAGSNTRGLFGGGYQAPGSPAAIAAQAQINYVTMQSLGNSADFGDLVQGVRYPAGFGSPTRAIWAGGRTNDSAPATNKNVIQYVTIASLGNATDFGDLTYGGSGGVYSTKAVYSSTRGCMAGGVISPAYVNSIDYVTISTTGNSQEFGDLVGARSHLAAMSSKERGVFAGGYAPSGTNTMTTITISSTGDSKNFGDLYSSLAAPSGLSDSHGGIS
jgi:hypothetical protein